jgi:hypothetical protein
VIALRFAAGSFSDAAGLAGCEAGELNHAKTGETRPSCRSRSDSRGMRVLINLALPAAALPGAYWRKA